MKRKRDLKSILLSEQSPPKKATFCTILIILGEKKKGKYSKGRKISDHQEGAELVKCGGILGW